MKKICEVCRAEFETDHPTAKYCCKSCRIRGHYLRYADKIKAYYKARRKGKVPEVKENPARKCKVCGKEFSTYHNVKIYCSYECYREANRRKKAKERRKLKVCPVCGKEFFSSRHFTTYCSEKCRDWAYHYRHPQDESRDLNTIYLFKCPNCGYEFKTKNLKRRYCSEKCRKEAANQRYKERHRIREESLRTCRICGTKFSHAQTGRYNYCSEKCRIEARRLHSLGLLELNAPEKPKEASLNKKIKEAAECGLSYGYYVAALRAGKTYEELRAAHLKNEFIERRRMDEVTQTPVLTLP